MFALKGGMESLIKALVTAQGTTLKLNAPLTDLAALRESGANIIVATDAATAGALLTPPLPPALAKRLAALEYVPLLTATVFVKKTRLTRFKEGVGVLTARDQGVRALGILFNSSAFPGRVALGSDLVSLTVMYGGALDQAAVSESDDRVRAWIVEDLSTLLGFTGSGPESLEHVHITRWKRALPHYTRDLRALWPELAAALPPGVAVFGNWTGQVSLRGMVESLSRRFPAPQTH
jgi:oxygen-dependent protoporphyrinogen oxidase